MTENTTPKYFKRYKGYILTHNIIRDEWYASKDGFVIGTGSLEQLERGIDAIVD